MNDNPIYIENLLTREKRYFLDDSIVTFDLGAAKIEIRVVHGNRGQPALEVRQLPAVDGPTLAMVISPQSANMVIVEPRR